MKVIWAGLNYDYTILFRMYMAISEQKLNHIRAFHGKNLMDL